MASSEVLGIWCVVGSVLVLARSRVTASSVILTLVLCCTCVIEVLYRYYVVVLVVQGCMV